MLTRLRPPQIVHDTLGRPEAVISLPDRLDVHQVEAIRQDLRQLAPGHNDRVALDASAVEHVDVAGLDCLIDVQAFCDGVGATVHLTNTSLALRLGIELAGAVGAPTDRPVDLLAEYSAAA